MSKKKNLYNKIDKVKNRLDEKKRNKKSTNLSKSPLAIYKYHFRFAFIILLLPVFKKMCVMDTERLLDHLHIEVQDDLWNVKK